MSVRSRFAGDEGASSLDGFIEKLQKEIASKEMRKMEEKKEN